MDEKNQIKQTKTKPPLVFNTFVLSIFEWPLKTGLLYIGQGHSRRLILKIFHTHIHPSETSCRAMASVDMPEGHSERSNIRCPLIMSAPYLLSPGVNFENNSQTCMTFAFLTVVLFIYCYSPEVILMSSAYDPF